MMTPLNKAILIGVFCLLAAALVIRIVYRGTRWLLALRKRRLAAKAALAALAPPPPAIPVVPMTRPAAASRPLSAVPNLRRIDPEELPIADPRDYQFGALTPVLAAMLPESDDRRGEMKKLLRNAGEYSAFAYRNFSAVRYLGLILPILIFGTLFILVPPELELLMLLAMIGLAACGWALPGILLRSKAAERLGEIERGMPDMLDMLNMCVSQGMTVPASLKRVGVELEQVYPALAKELQIVSDHSRVGSLEQALVNLSERVNVPEVHSFTSLLIQTERMGTSVSDALIEYSDNMRESHRQQADARANAATFKLLFPTVFCLMPAVFLFLLGPAIIQLSEFFNRGGSQALNATTEQALQFSEEP